jgi:hypothetical protein
MGKLDSRLRHSGLTAFVGLWVLLFGLTSWGVAYTKDDVTKTATSDGSLSDTQSALSYIDGRNEDGWVLTVGSSNGSYSWGSSLTPRLQKNPGLG